MPKNQLQGRQTRERAATETRSMTPEQLQALHDAIEKVRLDALFGGDDGDSDAGTTLPPEAEQYFLLALAALDTAARYAALAKIARMQGR